MGQKSCRLGNHQDIVILIDNAKMALRLGHRLFLHKGLDGLLRQVKLEGIACMEQFIPLRSASVQFDAFFPQHLIQEALGGLVHIFQQELIQPLIFLIFCDSDLFQGIFLQRISCGSMPGMR